MRVVNITLPSADTVIGLNSESLTMRQARQDKGTGFVLGSMMTDVDGTMISTFKIAVIDGRFDQHRNDVGELWVLESEISDE
jgi:hypothetical protein